MKEPTWGPAQAQQAACYAEEKQNAAFPQKTSTASLPGKEKG